MLFEVIGVRQEKIKAFEIGMLYRGSFCADCQDGDWFLPYHIIYNRVKDLGGMAEVIFRKICLCCQQRKEIL